MKNLVIAIIVMLCSFSLFSQNQESYSQDHFYGDTIYFSAYPQEGWKFVGWYRNDTLLSTQQHGFMYVVDSDATLVAELEPIIYRIEVIVNPAGKGLISGSGEYYPGDVAVITGKSNAFLKFGGFVDEQGTKHQTSSMAIHVTRDRVFVALFSFQMWVNIIMILIAVSFVYVLFWKDELLKPRQ